MVFVNEASVPRARSKFRVDLSCGVAHQPVRRVPRRIQALTPLRGRPHSRSRAPQACRSG